MKRVVALIVTAALVSGSFPVSAAQGPRRISTGKTGGTGEPVRLGVISLGQGARSHTTLKLHTPNAESIVPPAPVARAKTDAGVSAKDGGLVVRTDTDEGVGLPVAEATVGEAGVEVIADGEPGTNGDLKLAGGNSDGTGAAETLEVLDGAIERDEAGELVDADAAGHEIQVAFENIQARGPPQADTLVAADGGEWTRHVGVGIAAAADSAVEETVPAVIEAGAEERGDLDRDGFEVWDNDDFVDRDTLERIADATRNYYGNNSDPKQTWEVYDSATGRVDWRNNPGSESGQAGLREVAAAVHQRLSNRAEGEEFYLGRAQVRRVRGAVPAKADIHPDGSYFTVTIAIEEDGTVGFVEDGDDVRVIRAREGQAMAITGSQRGAATGTPLGIHGATPDTAGERIIIVLNFYARHEAQAEARKQAYQAGEARAAKISEVYFGPSKREFRFVKLVAALAIGILSAIFNPQSFFSKEPDSKQSALGTPGVYTERFHRKRTNPRIAADVGEENGRSIRIRSNGSSFEIVEAGRHVDRGTVAAVERRLTALAAQAPSAQEVDIQLLVPEPGSRQARHPRLLVVTENDYQVAHAGSRGVYFGAGLFTDPNIPDDLVAEILGEEVGHYREQSPRSEEFGEQQLDRLERLAPHIVEDLAAARGRLLARDESAGMPASRFSNAGDLRDVVRRVGGETWREIVEGTGIEVLGNFRARGLEAVPVPEDPATRNADVESVLLESLLPAANALAAQHPAGAFESALQERISTMREFLTPLPGTELDAGSPRSNRNLTGLFRNGDFWIQETRRTLRRDWIPAALAEANRTGRSPMLVLKSLGASTGMEPLSLAMLVDFELRRAGQDPAEWNVSIDAFEINPAALYYMTRGMHRAELTENHQANWDGHPADAPNLFQQARQVLGRRAARRYLQEADGDRWYALAPEFAERFRSWLRPAWTNLMDSELRPAVDDGRTQGLFAMGIHGVLPEFTSEVQPWIEEGGWRDPNTAALNASTTRGESFWERGGFWVGMLRLALLLAGIRILQTRGGVFILQRGDPLRSGWVDRPYTVWTRIMDLIRRFVSAILGWIWSWIRPSAWVMPEFENRRDGYFHGTSWNDVVKIFTENGGEMAAGKTYLASVSDQVEGYARARARETSSDKVLMQFDEDFIDDARIVRRHHSPVPGSVYYRTVRPLPMAGLSEATKEVLLRRARIEAARHPEDAVLAALPGRMREAFERADSDTARISAAEAPRHEAAASETSAERVAESAEVTSAAFAEPGRDRIVLSDNPAPMPVSRNIFTKSGLEKARGTLVETLPNGAMVYELPAGKYVVRLYVDVETQAAMRELPQGMAYSVFGSKALEMVDPEGPVARTGYLGSGGDIDILDSPFFAHEVLEAAYQKRGSSADSDEERVEYLSRYAFGRDLGDTYSLVRIVPRFISSGDGNFEVSWYETESGTRGLEQGLEDLREGTIRYVSSSMDTMKATQGMYLWARYPGTSFEARTEQMVSHRLGKWQSTLQTGVGPGSVSMAPQGGLWRFEKIFAKAEDPGKVVELLKAWGRFRGGPRDQILRFLSDSGRLGDALASRWISDETRLEIGVLNEWKSGAPLPQDLPALGEAIPVETGGFEAYAWTAVQSRRALGSVDNGNDEAFSTWADSTLQAAWNNGLSKEEAAKVIASGSSILARRLNRERASDDARAALLMSARRVAARYYSYRRWTRPFWAWTGNLVWLVSGFVFANLYTTRRAERAINSELMPLAFSGAN